MADSRTLSYTAEQIDAILAAAQRCSNRNLLDNWYFGNPVDQRQGRVVKPNTTYYSDNQLTTAAGITSAYVKAYRYALGTVSGVNYASFKLEDKDTAPTYYAAPENAVRGYTGAGYGIDRWILQEVTNTSLIINDGFVTLKATNNDGLIQNYEREKFTEGDIITVSILTEEGELLTATHTVSTNVSVTEFNDIWNMAFGINGGIWYLWCPITYVGSEQTINIKAIKLELGDHQTLAHQDENGNWVPNEPPPDKNMELLKCQRYYQLYSSADKRPVKAVDCRPTMRVDPVQGTIVIDGTTYYYNSAEL